MKGREEVTFTVLIQEIKEVGGFSNFLICEPCLLDGASRTPMESLAVVVATETIAPLLSMDVKVLLPHSAQEPHKQAGEVRSGSAGLPDQRGQ